MRDTLLKFSNKPMPILDQITRGLEEVTKIVETLIKMSKSKRKEAYDSAKEGSIQVVMEKA